MTADDEAWGRHFLYSLIEPLELFSEDDVSPDSAGAVARVLAYVGVELPAGWEPEAGMAQQADELNDDWYAAYQRDASARLRG